MKRREYWSNEVTRKSNVLDLESGVFTWDNPSEIAKSLKRSAENSTRRKGTSFQSAMSMLNFYINRAGKNLPQAAPGAFVLFGWSLLWPHACFDCRVWLRRDAAGGGIG